LPEALQQRYKNREESIASTFDHGGNMKFTRPILGAAILTAIAVAAQASVTVDCSKGQTIKAALAANPAAAGGLTILVNGTCIEDVFVSRVSEVTIEGNPTATLRPVHPTDNTVAALSQLELQGISIEGGSTAVYVGPHAYVTIEDSTITGPGNGVFVWDSSALDTIDSRFATTGAYGIDAGLGSTLNIFADTGKTMEVTTAQTAGIFCSSSKINLQTAGSGTILIKNNKGIGIEALDCGTETYNPSGIINISNNGTAGKYAAGFEQFGGVSILNTVEISDTIGLGAIYAALNAAMQLNKVTLTGNTAGILANQGATVQFVPYGGVSTVKDNGSAVFSCYQGGQIYVDKIAGTITPTPTKAQLGCLHVGGP
jgi:hypothetical protein